MNRSVARRQFGTRTSPGSLPIRLAQTSLQWSWKKTLPQALKLALRQESTSIDTHAREFNIPGITFGCRYDGSPIIDADGEPPPDQANVYIPTSCPGGRAPHLWLGEDHSLYDEFGFEWTLLRLGPRPASAAGIKAAFAEAGLELKVLDVTSEHARAIYEADLVLIRPDQVVAFRGQEIRDAQALIAKVSGRVQPVYAG